MENSNGFEGIRVSLEEDNIVISSEDNFEVTEFNNEVFLDDKLYKKFIKASEKLVRTSSEYKLLISSLKELNVNSCTFFPNITHEDATIEMHHYPLSLFQITSLVIDKMLANGEKINSFSVADRVMEEHFNLRVGLIPLSKTIHELAHKGKVFISLNQVIGNFNDFLIDYALYLSDSDLEDLNKLIQYSKESYSKTDETFPIELTDKNLIDRQTSLFTKEDIDLIDVLTD